MTHPLEENLHNKFHHHHLSVSQSVSYDDDDHHNHNEIIQGSQSVKND